MDKQLTDLAAALKLLAVPSDAALYISQVFSGCRGDWTEALEEMSCTRGGEHGAEQIVAWAEAARQLMA